MVPSPFGHSHRILGAQIPEVRLWSWTHLYRIKIHIQSIINHPCEMRHADMQDWWIRWHFMNSFCFYEKQKQKCILFAWQHTMEVIGPIILLEMEATQNQIDEESQPVNVAKERTVNKSKPPSLILTTICLVQFQEPSSHNQIKRGGTLSSLS